MNYGHGVGCGCRTRPLVVDPVCTARRAGQVERIEARLLSTIFITFAAGLALGGVAWSFAPWIAFVATIGVLGVGCGLYQGGR